MKRSIKKYKRASLFLIWLDVHQSKTKNVISMNKPNQTLPKEK